MLEKRWVAVPAQLFTANGTTDGKITVANSALFKVKQVVVLVSSSVASRDDVEIKRISDKNTIYVGPIGGNIDSRIDASAYLTADGASIRANEQKRSNVPEQEIERLTYEEEPTVARRVILVDTLGDKVGVLEDINGVRRLAVDAQVTVGEVDIDYPSDITVTNVSVVTANTEMSYTLNSTSMRFAIKVRNGESALRVGLASGDVLVGPYFKVNRGVVFDSGDMDFTMPFTVYFSSDVSGVIVEIIDWHK